MIGREKYGTRPLVFIDDVTAAKSSRMYSEVYRSILSAQILPYSAKLIRFSVQMHNLSFLKK